MSKRTDRSLIIGLDIGTSKVVALVGEVTADGNIEVIGLGSQRLAGLKKRRGGQHRVHRAVHPAGGGGG